MVHLCINTLVSMKNQKTEQIWKDCKLGYFSLRQDLQPFGHWYFIKVFDYYITKMTQPEHINSAEDWQSKVIKENSCYTQDTFISNQRQLPFKKRVFFKLEETAPVTIWSTKMCESPSQAWNKNNRRNITSMRLCPSVLKADVKIVPGVIRHGSQPDSSLAFYYQYYNNYWSNILNHDDKLCQAQVQVLQVCLPLCSSSCQLVFLWCCLPVRSSSHEVALIWGCLHVRSFFCKIIFI